MKKEETVDYHIRLAWLAIARMYNQQASQFNATMSMGFALLNIDAEKGTPATKIAPQMGLEPRSLTRLLRTLEDKGVIYREVDQNDKRSVRIRLTEAGKQWREEAKKIVLRFNEMVREEIPEEKLNVFFDVIRHIARLVEKNNIYYEVKH
ncbi:MAG: MarR family transcriptional regulator [Cyclobacteriaceae bacterium]|nr:MarR family transcriptional regulator [Cyclobacteriaceae bacterium]MCX7637640.1 MarR family transcriptional regulator [Cyclobacteriaceae bacterium]MDW8331807.1 MarR family transcriptional regulator [Cyclobacteriaceae bacterium]